MNKGLKFNSFSVNNTMAPSLVTRSSSIKSPVPNHVTHAAGSVVSDLTTPNPAAALFQNLDSDDDDDKDSYDHLINEEHEKDMDGGHGGDSDEEGDECLIHFEGNEDCESEEDSVDIEIKDCGGKSKRASFVDLTDSSGSIVGNIIVDESDNCRMELDTSDKKDVKTHKPPSDWMKPDTQHEMGELFF